MKPDHYYTIQKIYSKWIKVLNARPETTKLPEENVCSKLLDISLGDSFFLLDTKRQQMQK